MNSQGWKPKLCSIVVRTKLNNNNKWALKGASQMIISQGRVWVIFFFFPHGILLCSNNSALPDCCVLAWPGGIRGDSTCSDDFTQLRVMLPDSQPVVITAPKMTSLCWWFPKGPGKAQNYQPSLIRPHKEITGQELLFSAQRWDQYLWRSLPVTHQAPNIPEIIPFWLVNLGSLSYVWLA